MVEEIGAGPLFGRCPGHVPALEVQAAHQHRQLGAEVDGIFRAEPVAQRVQRRAQHHVGVVAVIGVQTFHQGLQPQIGLLDRGVEDRQTSGAHGGLLCGRSEDRAPRRDASLHHTT
jgi:hypothetical protein